MSVAYYIVLDNDDPGFDPFVNGKSLSGKSSGLTQSANNSASKNSMTF